MLLGYAAEKDSGRDGHSGNTKNVPAADALVSAGFGASAK